MPETSQDAFEAMHPKQQAISIEEIRARSNSINRQRIPAIQVDNLIAAESNFWPSHAIDTNGNRPQTKRESRISTSEVDSCYTVPDTLYGYKRESSHR